MVVTWPLTSKLSFTDTYRPVYAEEIQTRSWKVSLADAASRPLSIDDHVRRAAVTNGVDFGKVVVEHFTRRHFARGERLPA